MSQILAYHVNIEDGIKLLFFWDTLLSVERQLRQTSAYQDLELNWRTKNYNHIFSKRGKYRFTLSQLVFPIQV